MFNKKLYLVILMLAVGLSACGAVPEAVQNLDLSEVVQEVAPEVEQAQVPQTGEDAPPADGQAPQGQAPNDQGQQGERPRIDLAAAATELGVTEEALKAAMGEPGQEKPELASVAAELGVTEEALIAALGIPADGGQFGQDSQGKNGQAGEGFSQHPQIDLAAAATELGVTEEALKTALGEPGHGRPDFAAAAAELGVTEEALVEALGIPEGGPQQGGAAPIGSQG